MVLDMNHYDKRSYKLFIILFAILFTVYLISVIYTRITAFNYAADLDKTVLIIDETPVTLRELGYYVAEVEGFTQKQAVLYDPNDPLVYWNLYFSARENSTFVSDYARETAINNCICDVIYESLAIDAGITLSDSMKNTAFSNANLFYVCLSDEQRKILGLSLDMVTIIEQRKLMASAYISYLLQTQPDIEDQIESAVKQNDTGTEDPLSFLSSTGTYYKEQILPLHNIQYNRKILRKLPLGRITVNIKD